MILRGGKDLVKKQEFEEDNQSMVSALEKNKILEILNQLEEADSLIKDILAMLVRWFGSARLNKKRSKCLRQYCISTLGDTAVQRS